MVACVAGAKRGRGGGREKGKREGIYTQNVSANGVQKN